LKGASLLTQFAERKGFTFFRVYYESTMKLPEKQRLAIYDAIVKYSFESDATALESVNDEIVKAILLLIKPTLDISIKKSMAGTKGGKSNCQSHKNHVANKNESGNVQNRSKTEAQGKQSISTRETDIVKDKKTRYAECSSMDLKQQGFDEFWNAFPRKVGKVAAKKIWIRIKPTAELHANILAAIIKQKKSLQWQRDNGQFIPNPSTWLNECRWDDELPERTSDAKHANFTQRDYSEEFLDKFSSNSFGNPVKNL
jgi:hypothetical protein